MVDGTSTRVVTCMVNRWRAKIDWRGLHNARNPPGEDGSNWHDLGNLCNLALKKEEEHYVPRTKCPRTEFHALVYILVIQSIHNRV